MCRGMLDSRDVTSADRDRASSHRVPPSHPRTIRRNRSSLAFIGSLHSSTDSVSSSLVSFCHRLFIVWLIDFHAFHCIFRHCSVCFASSLQLPYALQIGLPSSLPPTCTLFVCRCEFVAALFIGVFVCSRCFHLFSFALLNCLPL